MDILFVFVAVCPALLITEYEFKGEGKKLSWQSWLGKAAGWFYVITLFNLLLLYIEGLGSFDFTALSVQFLMQYMISSTIIIFLTKLGKWAVEHAGKGGRNV